jgi:hypothetical protein
MAGINPSRSTWPPSPPPDETETERIQRTEKEKEAKRVSDLIDQALAVERAERKKIKQNTKILLIGVHTFSCPGYFVLRTTLAQDKQNRVTASQPS